MPGREGSIPRTSNRCCCCCEKKKSPHVLIYSLNSDTQSGVQVYSPAEAVTHSPHVQTTFWNVPGASGTSSHPAQPAQTQNPPAGTISWGPAAWPLDPSSPTPAALQPKPSSLIPAALQPCSPTPCHPRTASPHQVQAVCLLGLPHPALLGRNPVLLAPHHLLGVVRRALRWEKTHTHTVRACAARALYV